MGYIHHTQDERYQIAIPFKAGQDKSDIARVVNRHKSTIGREMKRNRGARGCRPKQAQYYPAALFGGPQGSRIIWKHHNILERQDGQNIWLVVLHSA